jgi:hypothetical protein
VPAVGDDPRPSLHNDDLGGEPVHHRRHQRLVVFAAIVLAGLFVNYLVNLTGKLSVRYGIPYADFLRRAAPHPAGLRSVQHGPEPSVPLRQRLEPAGVRPFAVAAVFSVATVWVPWLAELSRFAWVIGAVIGAVLYIAAMAARTPGAFDRSIPVSPAPVTTAPTTAQTSSS